MAKILVIVALFVCSLIPAQAQSNHTKSVTISPFLLIFPIVEVTAEFKTDPKVGFAGIAGIGSIFDVSVYEIGGQYNYYVLGDFRHGMQLGGEAKYMHMSVSDDNSNAEGTGNIISAGPYVGYKYAAHFGFTFHLQGGYSVGAGTVKVTDSNGSGGTSLSAAGPILNINAGWSF